MEELVRLRSILTSNIFPRVGWFGIPLFGRPTHIQQMINLIDCYFINQNRHRPTLTLAQILNQMKRIACNAIDESKQNSFLNWFKGPRATTTDFFYHYLLEHSQGELLPLLRSNDYTSEFIIAGGALLNNHLQSLQRSLDDAHKKNYSVITDFINQIAGLFMVRKTYSSTGAYEIEKRMPRDLNTSPSHLCSPQVPTPAHSIQLATVFANIPKSGTAMSVVATDRYNGLTPHQKLLFTKDPVGSRKSSRWCCSLASF